MEEVYTIDTLVKAQSAAIIGLTSENENLKKENEDITRKLVVKSATLDTITEGWEEERGKITQLEEELKTCKYDRDTYGSSALKYADQIDEGWKKYRRLWALVRGEVKKGRTARDLISIHEYNESRVKTRIKK